jgi:hypothetical protein
MFWHVDEKRYNVDELIKTADTMVERAQERGVSPKDLDALREAKTHMWATQYIVLTVCSDSVQHIGCERHFMACHPSESYPRNTLCSRWYPADGTRSLD